MNERFYQDALSRGTKILEQIMSELNKISNEHIRKDPHCFRREEDLKEMAVAIGIYDIHLDGLLT